EQPREGAMDEPDALLELRLLMLFRSAQRTLEIVEDRDEFGDQALVRERDVLLALTGRPLLVVLEVGGEPEEAIVLDGCLPRLFRARLLPFDLLLAHEVGASSSPTSYSPSSTTSS